MTIENDIQPAAVSSQSMAETRAVKWLIALTLGLIVLLGAFLRFYELGAYSVGNSYYAATVQSMLLSWKNFFFAAFEPGGSVTVDKPPLGFWVQAVSAYIFGVNGFALALPQALAGVFSLPLIFWLVKRHFGPGAGLIAALALAVIPVTISTERNNTIDGLLVFVLLLATWAFLVAVERGKLRYLLLGAVLVGLGFNIKMLQAYMVLPALYALYFLGARHPWWKRTLHLGAASLLLLAVSLSWAVIVDLTPADQRPFIGSSTDNTVIELITGHNGIRRLIGGQVPTTGQSSGNLLASPPALAAQDGANGQLAGTGFVPGLAGDGQQPQPNQDGGAAQRPGGGRNQEVGAAGWLRLFSEPLATEAAWLLPFALLGIPLLLWVLGWHWPLTAQQLGVVLWAGWLLPVAGYFSLTTGLFHAYYLIMLGPPVAALVAASFWALWKLYQRQHWLAWVLLLILSVVTVAAQSIPLMGYPQAGIGVLITAWAMCLAGLVLLAWRGRLRLGQVALLLVIAGLVVAPLSWSGLTVLNSSPNVSLPRSGPGDAFTSDRSAQQGARTDNALQLSTSQEMILDYLLANTGSQKYLVATLNARQASSYILNTLRPVLTFGGFSGGDNVISVEELAEIVASGQLRFVIGGSDLQRSKPEIAVWLQQNCQPVTFGASSTASGGQPAPLQQEVLYDCGIS